MKQYYIYEITNLINNKKYIGQHYGEINDSYFGSGTLIKKAITKYGKENFKKEILEICDNYDELNKQERKWIEYYDAVNNENYYNIAEGGYNSNPCAGRSEEQENERRKKLSIAASGQKNHFYGQHLCGKDNPNYGKKRTEESKEKMRQAKLGENAPNRCEVAIFDKDNNFIQTFPSMVDLQRFLGLSPNGSTQTIKKHINNNTLYHNYYIKLV